MSSVPGSIFASGLVFQRRYRLDDPLAKGGMAEVWRASDLVLQREVAIKLLHPHLAADPGVVERFRREAIAAARLTHPNIVPTFDTGIDHEATYIVLGLVDGPSLAEVLRKRQLTVLETASLGRQIADALDHAHNCGIIHRDIKAANILLVDDEKRVMVADFGIAKAVAEAADPSLTLPGFVVGTTNYVAPEQISGVEAGPRTDVFALGVLLHEMVCGHTTVDLPTQLTIETSGEPAWLCSDVPPPLDAIVAVATSRDPAKRYATAAALRDALATCEQDIRASTPHVEPSPPPSIESTDDPSSNTPSEGPKTLQTPVVPPPHKPPRANLEQKVALARAGHKRHRVLTASAFISLVLLAAGIGRFFGSLTTGDDSPTTTVPVDIAPTAVASFDPLGSDRVENDTQATAAIDQDSTSSWSTETYASRRFGNLKPGVGLIVQLPASTKVSSVEVTSTSSDWAASIYMTGKSVSSLNDWGTPVTSLSDIDAGTAVFNTKGGQGDRLLVWITDLGAGNRVSISDIRVVQG